MRFNQRIRRRDLLGASAAAGVAAAIGLPAIAQSRSPNEKLSIAGIGVGGQGAWDIGNCAGENIVALCDVDERRCAASVERFPKAKRYRDFRKMLDELGKPDRRGGRGHARPHPCRRCRHGHASGQALLLRKAAGAYGPRGPRPGRHRLREETGHADGHADPCRGELPPRRGIGRGGGDRPDPRGPRVARGEV